jgi:hypothetical protein
MATLAELFEARSGSPLEQLRRRSDPAAAANTAAEFLNALRVEFWRRIGCHPAPSALCRR